jgi:hypothetical protein
MNFGPALLLVGAFLIAVTPAWADNMPHSGLVKKFQGTATSAIGIALPPRMLIKPPRTPNRAKWTRRRNRIEIERPR